MRTKHLILTTALFLLWTLAGPVQADQNDQAGQDPPVLVLTNATIIDGTGAPPAAEMTIVIRGGRIEGIHPSASIDPPPPGAQVLDLSGMTVLPGLIEAHTHLRDFYGSRQALLDALERYLYSGVVALREMAGDSRVSAGLDRAARLGEIASPHIHYSAVMMGPHFYQSDIGGARVITRGAERDTAWIQVVTADTDLPLAVARAAGTGATALKLYIEMEPDLVRAITKESHRQGLKVWAHPAVFPSSPIEVVEAGVDGISHVCGLAWQDPSLDPRRFAIVSRTNRPVFDPGVVRTDSAEMRALFDAMRRQGTFFDATFSIYPKGGAARFGCEATLMTRLAKAASEAGVTFLTGTDWHAPADAAYPSLHEEIEALVAHGILSPLEAITAATSNGARALGIDDRTGTVEAGKAADLVILQGNPVEDIAAIRSVYATLVNGKLYRRSEYEAKRRAR